MNIIHCKDTNLTLHKSNPSLSVGHSYGERTTSSYEFDFILQSNRGKIITEGQTVELAPGMFFVRFPGTRVEGIASYSSWFLTFYTTEYIEFSEVYYTLSPQLCQPIFQQIYDLHVQKPKDYLYQIDYHVNTLLFHLYQSSIQKENNSHHTPTLAMVYDEMKNSWRKNLPLDYYVKLSGYSKSRFCHLFQEEYHISPVLFLHELRLQSICYQLIETERPIKELMIEHGYSNEQSFFRTFKLHTGETPLSYRRNHRFH